MKKKTKCKYKVMQLKNCKQRRVLQNKKGKQKLIRARGAGTDIVDEAICLQPKKSWEGLERSPFIQLTRKICFFRHAIGLWFVVFIRFSTAFMHHRCNVQSNCAPAFYRRRVSLLRLIGSIAKRFPSKEVVESSNKHRSSFVNATRETVWCCIRNF